ncbi:DUF3040 domain-containing protein [Cellulosimicrobium arenosum]|uniref:DUF3040 domain-containing protein n=1 Tax=Cellulosimicrobium arenosum TaxID=2708133 RepID=A0A927IZB8_9MICO|nr:DUF3040 domain-containing protein [Cellulosimicrobium arenosum]MBD8079206.1 DUF3040 domain-containing protein [Cellulosimicrobium arenosum]
MPLSEYEQKVLEQMERALTSDDPRLANTLQSPRRRSAWRYVLAGLGVVVGLLLLVLGAALSQTWLGVAGFALMFGGVVLVFQRPRRSGGGPVGTVQTDGSVRPAAPAKASRTTFLNRLEERWERRREQGGR